MTRILGVLSVFLLALAACDNAGAGGGGGSPWSGKISNWNLGSGYSVAVYDDDSSATLIGPAEIASDGSFSLSMDTPPTSALSPLSALAALFADVTVSDGSVDYLQVDELRVLDAGGTAVGTISYAANLTSQEWWYATGASTVSGSGSFLVTLVYDVSVLSGWTSVTATTDQSLTVTYTNGTVSGGSWTYQAD